MKRTTEELEAIIKGQAVVEMRQARLALLQAGKLQQVEAAIAAMSGVDGDAARIEWNFAKTVKRNHQLVDAIQDMLAMTDAEVDELFVVAGGL